MYDSGVVRTADLGRFAAVLSGMPAACDDAERIERIRLLEELKSVAAAAQARETAGFAASQRAAQKAAGVPAGRVGRGIAAQVGLARRISPHQAQRYVGWAGVLVAELPGTLAALTAGRVSEWRALLVARETIWLSREQRAALDAQLAARLERLGNRQVEGEARKLAYRLDPEGFLARIRGAQADRRVTLRPAPDTMARLSGLLPVAQGVAAYAALNREADSKIAAGDPRGRGQIMADTLVQRLTGQTRAEDVPVEINLIMTDQALLHPSPAGAAAEPAHAKLGAELSDAQLAGSGRDEAALLLDYGPIPAPLARQLVLNASERTPMWLRRLYRHPGTGQLAAMESRRRTFTPAQRLFLRLRDHTCRTPYCDAPIRHTDHVLPAEHGGPTSVANGQGLCQACNHAKQAPGWHSTAHGDQIQITTPTGHRYEHEPPAPPGATDYSEVEQRLRELLQAA